ncbi:hypothetical protein L1987_04643 [Smallanthus sonchifolius]|uniref:Uncharacterized protein n=1 Tax=Smallanthus sonchifolius TaxID=185202 RepID=A0ACB9JTB6_9ASTR|nr:hypothetical protein L1987_04643 [Smallanthus sonchifolius]
MNPIQTHLQKGNQKTVKAYARYEALDFNINVYMYKCNFDVPEDFGEIGAILVENEYSKKMFFKTIALDNGVTFTCDSWSYLPSETPKALKSLREEDLESLRGNGEGERKSYDRIYDYDVYNDLGAPDLSLSLARPVLGGEERPYPRRCRTGRPMSTKAQKKLFMLDYHDLLLPYVNKTRELKRTTLYGSRTLMFLTPAGTLRPLAIELTRPPSDGKPQWKHVYTPSWDATGAWLWKLAKAHVLSHDSAYHQLVSHWLRTHCVTEPYIIATNRHLSQMHPIQRLLVPHFRYTMQINALARLLLINASGIIETTFSPGKYCMQICADAYDQLWRFDHDALPADLISRGMAVEDPAAPHGVKLTIEDYPFANDGLLIYDAIKQWATSYVNHYYPQANLVESDEELQAWWNEIRTVGHGDKKDEPWWPQLKTQDDLIGIVSTIMWVTSGHHSAVNFGQYDFGGYFPNRPTIGRTKMPDEDPTDEEWQSFIKRPEDVLLKCFPSQIQATTVMTVLDVLSSHSPEEEYIGGTIEPAWEAEPAVKAAFGEFQGRLNQLESIIDSRNNDPLLRNRSGAGLVPYQLLKPYSDRGVTGKGVPNSISI